MKQSNAFLCCLSLMLVVAGMMSGDNKLVADESGPVNAVKSVKESDVSAERKTRSKPRRQKLEAARKKSSETNATEKSATKKNATEKITPSQNATAKEFAQHKAMEKQRVETKLIEKALAEKKLAPLKPDDSKATATPSAKFSNSRFQMMSVGKRIVILDTQSGETRIIESDEKTMQQSVEIGKSWVTVTVLVNAPGRDPAKSLLNAVRK